MAIEHIVKDWPAMIDEIAHVFPDAVRIPGVIFAWGNILYNPYGGRIPKWIIKHEDVHSNRQGKDPRGWWDRYLGDQKFRLVEEALAHREEYLAYTKRHGSGGPAILRAAARRLSGPLYGHMVDYDQAERYILGIDKVLVG